MAQDESLPCTFSGFGLHRSEYVVLEQNQNFYLKKLEKLDKNCLFKDFRSMIMNLAWFANTSPDCQF